MSIESVVIIGSGRAATCIGKALRQKGIEIVAVYSRNIHHARVLAKELNAFATDSIQNLPDHADLYLIAVSDEAIHGISQQLNVNGLIVHTSGSADLEALEHKKRAGVFYALQTFNKHIQPDFTEIPILIETNNNADGKLLKHLASRLSNRIYEVNSKQRQALHVAAVFANNFTNHLFGVARTLLENNNLPFELIVPLMQQTTENAIHNHPFDVQTGPVVRKDYGTIMIHIELLKDYPEYRQLYELLSQSIVKQLETHKAKTA